MHKLDTISASVAADAITNLYRGGDVASAAELYELMLDEMAGDVRDEMNGLLVFAIGAAHTQELLHAAYIRQWHTLRAFAARPLSAARREELASVTASLERAAAQIGFQLPRSAAS